MGNPAGERASREEVAAAIRAFGASLARDRERVAPGPHERREFAPALKRALEAAGVRGEVLLDSEIPMRDWNRPRSQVDLVLRESGRIELAAELKVWDIGHQLFDLAKCCCLLRSGVASAYLLCIAQRAEHFARMPGGELFPGSEGEAFAAAFADLFRAHPGEWRSHLAESRPRPITVPSRFATRAVTDPVPLVAYPGHQLRAVEVEVLDPTLVPVPAALIASA